MRALKELNQNKISMLMISFLVIQILLTLLAIHKDANSILDFIGVPFWCSWANILMFLVFKFNGKAFVSKFNYALIGAFLATSIAIIIFLILISLIVLINGPLKESALIFVSIPAIYLIFGLIGGIFGIINFNKPGHP